LFFNSSLGIFSYSN